MFEKQPSPLYSSIDFIDDAFIIYEKIIVSRVNGLF
jgi:hypothetical protein